MAATTEATEGPVLSLMTKRLRNLRKKHKRILQLEDEISQGKTLNKDQEEVLRSKPSVLTLIDEYEKLRHPLSTALQEELQQHHQPQKPAAVAEPDPNPEEPVLEDLLKLLYFGSLFDVKPQSEFTSTMLTRTHERGCCLTYDYVTDDATDLLGEKDLDMISILGSLVVSRPGDSSLSHKNALRTCLQHAKLWLANSHQPINDATDVTYAALRERLNKILASDYYTTSPEMKAAVEVAAAAAAGNYSPPAHVPVQGSSVSSEITVQTESDYAPYEEKDEETEHSEGQEAGVDQSSPVEELPKEPSETRHAVDGNSIQQDNEPEGDTEEQNHRDVESRDQQQAIKSTTASSPSSNSPIHFEQFEQKNLLNNLKTTTKMNNFDSHPRILSLSSASTPSSIPTTPSSQSRRQSHESAHDAHHFVNQEEKTQHKLNLSIKKMWEGVKKHAIEHHKSVNAAYMASYGCGAPSGTVTQGKPL